MSAEDFVSLSGGLTVPAAAFELFHDLATHRGLLLRSEAGVLRVSTPDGGKPDLSAEDVTAIKKWKLHLIALIDYRPPADPPIVNFLGT